MARQKEWTADDKARALQWLINKGMGALRETAEAGTATIERLASIEDLSEFGRAIEAALLPEARKRLLATLRQHKHLAQQDDDEGKADAGAQQTADAGACQSCARLKAQVLNLEAELASARMSSGASDEVDAFLPSSQQQIATAEKLLAEHMQPIHQANEGDPTALVDWLRQHLYTAGSAWHQFTSAISAISASQAKASEDSDYIETLQDRVGHLEWYLDEPGLLDEDGEPIESTEADAGAQDEDGHQPVDQGHQPADEDCHQVQAALSAHQVAALALARSYMAAGQSLDSAARAASGKLRNALGCGLGEGGDMAVAPIHRLLKASEGQAITPASKAVRDEVIIILVKAGVQYKPLARALGISDGTVRNVIKRHQQQAEPA